MPNRIEELKAIAAKQSESFFSQESEMWKLANAKRENSASDYSEADVQKAHERGLNDEIEQAGTISAMFLNLPEVH